MNLRKKTKPKYKKHRLNLHEMMVREFRYFDSSEAKSRNNVFLNHEELKFIKNILILVVEK